jgi:hypothetical protein
MTLGQKVREKIMGGEEREKERENNCVNSGHYVCHAARLQRRTGSARTSLGPICISLTQHALVYISLLYLHSLVMREAISHNILRKQLVITSA